MSQPVIIDEVAVNDAITAIRSTSNQLLTTTPQYVALPEGQVGPLHAVYDVFHAWLLPTQSLMVDQSLRALDDRLCSVLAQFQAADEASGRMIQESAVRESF